MAKQFGWLRFVLCLALFLGVPQDARGQADPQNFLFNSGQSIQPVFEGWTHNPDGSFEMHFGYLNRNYVEELHVPVGAENRFESGELDQSQPTFFYPRTQRRVFSVTVPADFGDRELVWTLAIRDEVNRAVAWLQPEWEISANPAARFYPVTEGQPENQPPRLAVEAARTINLSDALTMTARVTDDGLPPPRESRGGGRSVEPSFEPEPSGPTLPVNVPQIQTQARRRPLRTSVEHVNVTWTQWRGPTGVTVEANDESSNGVATLTARFEVPGEYVFRVQASDGLESVTETVEVTVQ